MLSQEVLSAAAAVEKKMYLALCEVEELTMELAQAVDRRDQVSVRMFLSLRQEQVDHLQEQKALREIEALFLSGCAAVQISRIGREDYSTWFYILSDTVRRHGT